MKAPEPPSRAVDGLLASELEGHAFACLEGCGFCCTFQPEVSRRELALLRARLAPRAVPVVVGEGRSYLGLQNKCGACTLLARRACQAYDLRPAHCRYFPFHVHFGEAPEVYVNYACRGVERAPGRDLRGAFASSVLAIARAEEIEEHARAARDAYAAFRRRARDAGAWGDADALAMKALDGAPFTRAWMERALRAAAEDATPEDMIADALAPFSASDVTKRPFYLAPDLRWLTFDGPTRVVAMDEAGALHMDRTLPALAGWEDVPRPVADALAAYLGALARRRLFAGSVYDVVDAHDYATSVEEATWWRLAEIVADLAVRARLLAAMGVPDERLADEVARFYDAAFLDSRSIGGFL